MLIVKGVLRLKLPCGATPLILDGVGQRLQTLRHKIFNAVGLADHWGDFDNVQEIVWPVMLARIDTSHCQQRYLSSFAAATAASPPSVAMQVLSLVFVIGCYTGHIS